MLETLSRLGITQEALDQMITVGNKMDLVSPEEWPGLKAQGMLPISATQVRTT